MGDTDDKWGNDQHSQAQTLGLHSSLRLQGHGRVEWVDGNSKELAIGTVGETEKRIAERQFNLWREIRPQGLGELRRDSKRSKGARAAALWAAARIMRTDGLELIGTEMGPDAAIYGGNFAMASIDDEKDARSEGRLLKASADELHRIDASRVEPDKRWHYRYVAAQLGWEAAALMPDQDAKTAEVLATAGGWLKGRDPDAADRFYKALVGRCSTTALGAKAEKAGWLPNMSSEAK